MRAPPPQLWTIGHSTRPLAAFLSMLQDAGIGVLADVRRFAGSRRNPQFSGDALAVALQDARIEYLPLPAMGGRRVPDAASPNTAWRVRGFRGYADHLASSAYIAARDELMRTASARPTCVMCAEALWWQCHRRLIADDFTARDWQVIHLLTPVKEERHALHPDAILMGDVLRYPGPQADLF